MAATIAAAPNEIDEFMNGALITWVCISYTIRNSLSLCTHICTFIRITFNFSHDLAYLFLYLMAHRRAFLHHAFLFHCLRILIEVLLLEMALVPYSLSLLSRPFPANAQNCIVHRISALTVNTHDSQHERFETHCRLAHNSLLPQSQNFLTSFFIQRRIRQRNR